MQQVYLSRLKIRTCLFVDQELTLSNQVKSVIVVTQKSTLDAITKLKEFLARILKYIKYKKIQWKIEYA